MTEDGCYSSHHEESTPAERIASIDREMARYREAQELKRQGHVMPDKYNDPERLITLSLERKAAQSEASRKQNQWYDDHDL